MKSLTARLTRIAYAVLCRGFEVHTATTINKFPKRAVTLSRRLKIAPKMAAPSGMVAMSVDVALVMFIFAGSIVGYLF